MVRIALVYAAAFAALIAVADAGWLPHALDRIHHLAFVDKIVHFTLYGLLALVANLALISTGRLPPLRAIVLGSIVVLIVATAEEYSNRFVAARDYSLGDLAANYLGVLMIGVLPLVSRFVANRDEADVESNPPTALG